MADFIGIVQGNILHPVILAFVLGIVAGMARAELSIPSAISKAMSIYLMFAIGLKGGVAVAASPFSSTLILALLVGMVLSFVMPFIAFGLLGMTTKLDGINRAAISAHYGSISIVTFVTATEMVRLSGLFSEGFMVAVAALMETPAIITGIWLAGRMATDTAPGAPKKSLITKDLAREVFLNASVVVLVGAFIIGLISTPEGVIKVDPFFNGIFQGVLCLFLLDMGLVAAERLRGVKVLSRGMIMFGIYMPLIGATLGTLAGWAIGLSAGGTVLLATLAASGSYIAVPAAMRLAMPKANPAISLTLSLAITFPFNVIVGIPLYLMAVRWLYGV
ncbi:MAG: sodium-dependent bicarbonate transport family permease [Rhodospirillaceae bacterium]